MKIITLRKKSGGTRTIYVPSREEKSLLGEIYEVHLQSRLNPIELPYAHGFMPKRGIVTNAIPHVGKAVTVSIDLDNFFDTVTADKFPSKALPGIVLEKCFIEGDNERAARQGLPTSPALANLAAKPLDEAIVKGLKKRGISATYTRYADDLSISLDKDNPDEIEAVKKVVFEAVARCGFKINKKKIKIQRAKAGRREICGLMVDDKGVHVPRRLKRKIRAARHAYRQAAQKGDAKAMHRAANSLVGLLEFSMLKTPSETPKRGVKKYGAALREANSLVKAFNLHWGVNPEVKKMIPDRDLGDGVIITNDPVYFLGMSSFTRRFTSCMALGQGCYHQGVAFWQRHPGVSLALELGDSVVSVKGVKRREIISRAIIYHLRNGKMVFGDIYSAKGHAVDTHSRLGRKLIEIGVRPCYEYSGELVTGHVVDTGEKRPYFDNVNPEGVTLRPSGRQAIRLRLK